MADLGAIGVSYGLVGNTPGKLISGTVVNANGDPVRRAVHFFAEAKVDPSVAYMYEKATYSDAVTGAYSAPFGDNAPRTVMVAGEAGYNALVFAGVTPA